ncbi:hypothetical protein M406DRAFT_71547 [Cryphonectria parasitica EP155]|uniref:Uncharacterized protein n=1 Tax=Cryphonectria parasitica (strain ATCC 38755 / EP155) TaxID=660469 RepID=A0A9P4Y873_CRYP1|nr:uncharacterized protein M406DRAFT_71547 [Cryphonectria parasitica EP155]KAF3768553.1 hypothetical protein M406DRAFT_71547 [Cryphonectria parasitica EP155]
MASIQDGGTASAQRASQSTTGYNREPTYTLYYTNVERFHCQRKCMILLKGGEDEHEHGQEVPFCSTGINQLYYNTIGHGGTIKIIEPPKSQLLPLAKLLDIPSLLRFPLPPMVLAAPSIALLENTLVKALNLLHNCNISFPVTRHNQMSLYGDDFSLVDNWSLYLHYNPDARQIHIGSNVSPTWKEDELAKARFLLFIPKIITYIRDKRFATAGAKVFLDNKAQDDLCDYFHHAGIIPDVAQFCATKLSPCTAKLALNFVFGYVVWGMSNCAYKVLQEVFGDSAMTNPLSISHNIHDANAVYDFYKQAVKQKVEMYNQKANNSNQVQTDVNNDYDEGDGTLVNDFDSETYCRDMGYLTSNNSIEYKLELERIMMLDRMTLSRLIICRAEIAQQLNHPHLQEWWEQAAELYKTFLVLDNTGPSTVKVTLCSMFQNGVYKPRKEHHPSNPFQHLVLRGCRI